MVGLHRKWVVVTGTFYLNGDMNGDGEIDLSDAIIIIYKSLGVK